MSEKRFFAAFDKVNNRHFLACTADPVEFQKVVGAEVMVEITQEEFEDVEDPLTQLQIKDGKVEIKNRSHRATREKEKQAKHAAALDAVRKTDRPLQERFDALLTVLGLSE